MKLKTNVIKYKDPNTNQYVSIPAIVSGGNASGNTDDDKQDKIDYNLNTESKEIVGAINELSQEIDDVNTSLLSAVEAGYAEIGTIIGVERNIVTDATFDGCDRTNDGTTNAYWNGITFETESIAESIILHPSITSTSFAVYVFNSDWLLVDSIVDINPVITDNAFDLPRNLTVPENGKIMLACKNGIVYSGRIDGMKEYWDNITHDTRYYLPFNIVYKTNREVTGIVFKKQKELLVKLTDYLLPKCVEADGEFTFIGRWFDKEIDGENRKCANADGSSVLFKVSGTDSLVVNFQTLKTPNYTPYFAISIDGGAFTRHLITDNTINLGNTNEHIIWIVVDGMGEGDPVYEKWLGNVGVVWCGVTGGTCKALNYTNKEILIIGDSIVEGINVLGRGANADVNSATNGFAFKTARKLNSIPLLCGYGGTGICLDNSFHKPIEAIDYNYKNVPVNVQKPDVIIIEHGTNDKANIEIGNETENDFINGYNELLDRLSIKYSGVPIVCMIPFNQSLASIISSIAENRSYCYLADTNNWNVTTTDSVHLDVNGANVASDKLAEELISIFGKQFFM